MRARFLRPPAGSRPHRPGCRRASAYSSARISRRSCVTVSRRDILLVLEPGNVGMAAQGAGARAGRVEQDGVELLGSGIHLLGIRRHEIGRQGRPGRDFRRGASCGGPRCRPPSLAAPAAAELHASCRRARRRDRRRACPAMSPSSRERAGPRRRPAPTQVPSAKPGQFGDMWPPPFAAERARGQLRSAVRAGPPRNRHRSSATVKSSGASFRWADGNGARRILAIARRIQFSHSQRGVLRRAGSRSHQQRRRHPARYASQYGIHQALEVMQAGILHQAHRGIDGGMRRRSQEHQLGGAQAEDLAADRIGALERPFDQ